MREGFNLVARRPRATYALRNCSVRISGLKIFLYMAIQPSPNNLLACLPAMEKIPDFCPGRDRDVPRDCSFPSVSVTQTLRTPACDLFS